MAKSNFVKRITPNHEAIVDWEILHPGGRMHECSADIGMCESAISIIRNSDVFIDYRNRRLADHHAHISESVVEKTELLACTSLEVLEERINSERDKISLGGVKDTADMALRALGFGASKQDTARGGGNVVVMVGATPEMLEAAREKMRATTPASVEEVTNDGEVAESGALLIPAPT